jgi:hypothetical protein
MVRTRSLLFCVAALTATAGILYGQSATESNLSGPVSPSVALATPTTTYELSGIDRVNYYNGTVSVQIPVGGAGGRGDANTSISVPISLQWSVQAISDNNNGSFSRVPETNLLTLPQQPAALVLTKYLPGSIRVFASSGSPNSCLATQDGVNYYWAGLGPYLTWMVYHAPNGSQTVLVDDAFGGQPQSANVNDCNLLSNYQPANRGTVFRSYDGSGMVFVANQNVFDTYLPGTSTVPGTLYFKNGTHYNYVVSFDSPDSVEDRNGNLTSYSQALQGSGFLFTALSENS